MPELPEVEVVRRGLQRGVSGRTIEAVDVLHPRAVRRHAAGAADFCDALVGTTMRRACRRGKYLWLSTSDTEAPGALALVGHLGMSGQLLVRPAVDPDERHLRIRFSFTDGETQLRFVDQRTFGGFFLDELAESGVPRRIDT